VRIRNQQVEHFESAAHPEFEEFMVRQLAEFTPLHSGSLGDAGIRAFIQHGVQRARAHDWTMRGPVRFYIETTVLLGIGFATDPQYPWAAEILNRDDGADQVVCADRLHDALMAYLGRVGGPDRKFAIDALRRARAIPYETEPVASAGFRDEVIARMTEMHPEKVEFVGERALCQLIPRAIGECERYGVAIDHGVALFIGLMFAVGHAVAEDPKYPWIRNTLTNPAIASASKRVERLYSKTMTYLDQVLENLGAE